MIYSMGDMIVKDNLNGHADNCPKMGNSINIFATKKLASEKMNGNEKMCIQNEHLKTLTNNMKKQLICQEALTNKYKCHGNTMQFEMPTCELSNGCGLDAGNTSFLKLKEMQSNWIELHKYIRFVYKNAISAISSNVPAETIPEPIIKSVKELIGKLCENDCQQLYIRLEVLVRDFVLEARDRLKDLQHNVDDIPVLYLRGLLASYGAFCIAAENLTPCLPQLDSLLMRRFSVNFLLLNKYLFQTCLYSDAFVQNNVPLYISQLRTSKSGTQYTNQELVHSYLAFDDEMTDIASRWLDVKKMILRFSKKRTQSSNKQPPLLEDWKVYREHRELAVSRIWQFRAVKRDLTEFDVQLLSLLDDITSRMSDLEISSTMKKALSACKNCNADILCSCDDCTIKHILACGLETPPISPSHTVQENTDYFNYTQLKQLGLPTKLCNKSVLESSMHGPHSLVDVQNVQSSLDHTDSNTSCSFSVAGEQNTNDKTPQTAQGNNESNLSSICNNKVNKMSKNILKLMTDKVISKGFVKSADAEVHRPTVSQQNTVLNTASTSTISSTANTATSSLATSKVPATTNVATSINQPLPAQNSDASASSVKQGRISKDITKPASNKVEQQCNHVQAATKKTKKDSNTLQMCKDGCNDHGSLKLSSKESRRCDCPHCEVFESTNSQVSGKYNKTRDRLRTRLNEKRNKALKEKSNSKNTENSSEEQNGNKLNIKNVEKQNVDATQVAADVDTRDIRTLLNFIEGTDRITKSANALKKAAKKSRRRERKLEEERLKEEERQRQEAERLLEEERKLEERRRQQELKIKQQNASKKSKNSNTSKSKETTGKTNKMGNCTSNGNKTSAMQTSSYLQPVCLENKQQNQTNKTGPMVTIKRVMEGMNSEPTVTITLKGSTPDKDKLLYTLVNGQSNIGKPVEDIVSTELSKKQRKKTKCDLQKNVVPASPVSKKERKKKKKELAKLQNQTNSINNSNKNGSTNEVISEKNVSVTATCPSKTDTSLNLQMLRLPPGITITKVDGPAVSRKLVLNTKNITSSNTSQTPMQSADNRSGVIVVDTVKLKQELPATEQNAPVKSKKNKKKKNKNKVETNTVSDTNTNNAYSYNGTDVVNAENSNCNSVVTIKNPMFYQLQESLNGRANRVRAVEVQKPEPASRSQQASIIKGANGMVTIRSPRLANVSASCNGHGGGGDPVPIHAVSSSLMSNLKPVIGPNTSVYRPAKADSAKPFNAQEILSGLPGIEITKINKNATRTRADCKKVFQPADVSIIPTNMANGANGDVYKLFYDNMDWSLESVFAPKDIKEDEVLDADELELEAFKRFCQQSVPPERKEKVAHLNVKDIVLKKKASSHVC